MRNSLIALAVCLGGAASWASSEGHAAAEQHGGAHPVDPPSYIMHHVADSPDWEIELPWTHQRPVLHVAEWFSFLKMETSPGACDQPVDAAWNAAPSIGRWMNGCRDLRPTKSILMMWIASALVFLLLTRAHRDASKLVPQGRAANSIEALVLFIRDEIAKPNIGEKEGAKWTPLLSSFFFFVLAMNWLGLIPGFFTATGNLAVTAGLAVMVFFLTQYASIRSAGLGGYLSHLTGGVHPALWAIMIPVEVLGLFTKPFALMVRLFANMVAGHLVLFFILGLIFIISPFVAPVSVVLAAALYFLEMFAGLVQAYVFTLLTSLFIGQGVAMGHHHGEEHAAHGEAH